MATKRRPNGREGRDGELNNRPQTAQRGVGKSMANGTFISLFFLL